jgi:hypothetical protein
MFEVPTQNQPKAIPTLDDLIHKYF